MSLPPLSELNLFIEGRYTPAASGDRAPVQNPATEEAIGEAPLAGPADADAALQAARDAFDQGPWPSMSYVERAEVLGRMHAHFIEHAASIQALIVREAGATLSNARSGQFDMPMKHARYALDQAVSRTWTRPVAPELVSLPNGQRWLGGGVEVRDPIGVVSAITPYNFPFFLNVSKVFPALVMGNTVVLKPAPQTPYQALLFGWAAEASGLPRGVLNIITGDVGVGAQLTTDARVDMVTFTGSDTVGAAIMAQCAPSLKKVHLELGGKSALIIRHDVDPVLAARSGLGFVHHCGQGCAIQTRHLVHNSIRKPYVAALKALLEQIRIGDPADEATVMGPLISAAQRSKVEYFVESGLKSGATLVTGGKRPSHLPQGFFHEPTLFDDVDNMSEIAQEEIFGPVAVVIGFDTDEEAVAIANQSKFGLGGAIQTNDPAAAYEMALRIRSGFIAINGGAGTLLSDAPFGGVKRSGIGREYGPGWLEEFSELKTVSYHAA